MLVGGRLAKKRITPMFSIIAGEKVGNEVDGFNVNFNRPFSKMNNFHRFLNDEDLLCPPISSVHENFT